MEVKKREMGWSDVAAVDQGPLSRAFTLDSYYTRKLMAGPNHSPVKVLFWKSPFILALA